MAVALSSKETAALASGDYLYGLDVSVPNGIRKFTLADVRGDVFHVKHFGAAGNGVADDTAEIQAAIDEAEANGGGVVYFPVGQYHISATLVINSNGVRLVGEGAAGNFDGDPDHGSELVWDGGAAAMVQYSAVSGAGNYPLAHVGMMGITLNAAGVATKGLDLVSVREGLFHDIFIRNPVTVAIDLNVVATLLVSRDSQQNLFDRIWIRAAEGGGENAIGIRLDGDATANASMNSFRQVQIQHNGGIGIQLLQCDSNEFYSVHLSRPSGAGIGVKLNGGASQRHARHNTFFGLQPGQGGVTATGTGLASPSTSNVIYGYSLGNSSPLPVVEPGAGLAIYTMEGQSYLNGKSRTIGDPTAYFIEDDFDVGGSSAGVIGRSGWSITTCTWVFQTGTIDHPGHARLTAGSGAYGAIHLRGSASTGCMDADEDFDITAIIRLTQTDTDTTFRVGLMNVVTDNPPAEGIYVEKAAADTQWFGVTRTGASPTRTAALITSDTGWHKIRIRRINSTTIGFTVDTNAEVTLAATVPTGALIPSFCLGSASGSKSMDVDYFSLAITGLAR
jgi:hypothetical protein